VVVPEEDGLIVPPGIIEALGREFADHPRPYGVDAIVRAARDLPPEVTGVIELALMWTGSGATAAALGAYGTWIRRSTALVDAPCPNRGGHK
jgi:hypothetical protein